MYFKNIFMTTQLKHMLNFIFRLTMEQLVTCKHCAYNNTVETRVKNILRLSILQKKISAQFYFIFHHTNLLLAQIVAQKSETKNFCHSAMHVCLTKKVTANSPCNLCLH